MFSDPISRIDQDVGCHFKCAARGGWKVRKFLRRPFSAVRERQLRAILVEFHKLPWVVLICA